MEDGLKQAKRTIQDAMKTIYRKRYQNRKWKYYKKKLKYFIHQFILSISINCFSFGMQQMKSHNTCLPSVAYILLGEKKKKTNNNK